MRSTVSNDSADARNVSREPQQAKSGKHQAPRAEHDRQCGERSGLVGLPAENAQTRGIAIASTFRATRSTRVLSRWRMSSTEARRRGRSSAARLRSWRRLLLSLVPASCPVHGRRIGSHRLSIGVDSVGAVARYSPSIDDGSNQRRAGTPARHTRPADPADAAAWLDARLRHRPAPPRRPRMTCCRWARARCIRRCNGCWSTAGSAASGDCPTTTAARATTR